MSGVTDSHKAAALVQSERSVKSAESAEVIAVIQGETERYISNLSVPTGTNSRNRDRLFACGNWHTRLHIGIMGDTLDPIRNGHLVAASEVVWVYNLDEVIFVPAGRPVFKLDKHATDAKDRHLMIVTTAVSNLEFTVLHIDIDRPGVTYTIDALCDTRAQHSDTKLFPITGVGAVAKVTRRKDADLMWDLTYLVAITRPDHSSSDGVILPERKVDTPEIPVLATSSTDVCRRAERDESIRYLVLDGVVQYVGKHGLYPCKDWRFVRRPVCTCARAGEG